MRPVVAIIEASADPVHLEREVSKAHIALQDAERKAESDQKRADSSRQVVEDLKRELGRLLCEMRKRYPDRGGGWGEWLNSQGIPSQRYSEAAELYRKSLIPDSGKSGDSNPDNDTDDDTPPDEFHILVESGRLRSSVVRTARQWPDSARRSIPGLLRDLADEIEAGI